MNTELLKTEGNVTHGLESKVSGKLPPRAGTGHEIAPDRLGARSGSITEAGSGAVAFLIRDDQEALKGRRPAPVDDLAEVVHGVKARRSGESDSSNRQ